VCRINDESGDRTYDVLLPEVLFVSSFFYFAATICLVILCVVMLVHHRKFFAFGVGCRVCVTKISLETFCKDTYVNVYIVKLKWLAASRKYQYQQWNNHRDAFQT
jgi:hypothetical protein